MFRRAPVELPIDKEDMRGSLWLLADIRAELVAMHKLLEDDEDGLEDT